MIADIDTRALPALESPTSGYDFDVSHDRELHQHGAVLNGYAVGRLDYTLTCHRVVLGSTVIVSSLQYHGIATELIGRVFDDVRPIGRAFIDRYHRYADLIDDARPGVPPII